MIKIIISLFCCVILILRSGVIMMVDIYDVLKNLMGSFNISIRWLEEPYDNLDSLDYGFRKYFYSGFNWYKVKRDYLLDCQTIHLSLQRTL